MKSSKYAFLSGCQIYGNQDTLYISGYLFAFKTLVVGNIDFIFGAGSGYFLNSTISPNEDGVSHFFDRQAGSLLTLHRTASQQQNGRPTRLRLASYSINAQSCQLQVTLDSAMLAWVVHGTTSRTWPTLTLIFRAQLARPDGTNGPSPAPRLMVSAMERYVTTRVTYWV